MTQRNENSLNHYWDEITSLLTNRFKIVFNMNVESVQDAKLSNLGPAELRPHYVTRRYTEFVASILFLTSQKLNILNVSAMLKQLRNEMEKLLNRLATQLQKKEEKFIFLINNYDLILSVINERGCSGEDSERFDHLLQSYSNQYAEMELLSHFNKLVLFVRAHSVKQDDTTNSQVTQPDKDKDFIEGLLKEFSEKWERSIEEINTGVMQNFSNFKNGMMIFTQCCKGLLTHYKLFLEIIRLYYKELRSNKYYVAETKITYHMTRLSDFVWK